MNIYIYNTELYKVIIYTLLHSEPHQSRPIQKNNKQYLIYIFIDGCV